MPQLLVPSRTSDRTLRRHYFVSRIEDRTLLPPLFLFYQNESRPNASVHLRRVKAIRAFSRSSSVGKIYPRNDTEREEVIQSFHPSQMFVKYCHLSSSIPRSETRK